MDGAILLHERGQKRIKKVKKVADRLGLAASVLPLEARYLLDAAGVAATADAAMAAVAQAQAVDIVS